MTARRSSYWASTPGTCPSVSALPKQPLKMLTRRRKRTLERPTGKECSTVSVLENDYVWGESRTVSDVPSVLVERLQHYFLTYKLLPGQRPQARIASVYGRSHALKVVRAAMADYDDHFVL